MNKQRKKLLGFIAAIAVGLPAFTAIAATSEEIIESIIVEIREIQQKIAALTPSVYTEGGADITVCEPEPAFNQKQIDKIEEAQVKAALKAAEAAVKSKVQRVQNLEAEERKAGSEELKAVREQLRAERKNLQELAKTRKKDLVSLMRRDPDAAYAFIFSDTEKNVLKSVTANCIEEPAKVSGGIEYLHTDFDDGTSINEYVLKTDSAKINLHQANNTGSLDFYRGEIIIEGYKLDDNLLFDGAEISPKINVLGAGFQPTPVLGQQKVLVILIDYPGLKAPSAAAMKDRVFNTANRYFLENSFGRVSLTGDVVGPYLMPSSPNNCGRNFRDVYALADRDIDTRQYSHIVFIDPVSCSRAAGSAGQLSYPTRLDGALKWFFVVSIYNYFIDRVIMHEFGHTFNSHHANFLNCGNKVLPASGCLDVEYGDVYSVMGGGSAHFNSRNKEYVGWLNPPNIRIADASGVYSVEPLELSTNGVQLLKVPRGTGGYIYVEYRQPIGFDARMPSKMHQGALLHATHIQGIGVEWASKSYLIDPIPEPSAIASDSVLPVGSTFIEPTNGNTIRVIRATPQALTVEVGLDNKGSRDSSAPIVNLTEPSDQTTVSDTITLVAEAHDNIAVTRVEFYLSGSKLLGSDASSPYTTSWNTTSVANGSYQLMARAYDAAGNVGQSAPVTVGIVNGQDTTPPPPSPVPVPPPSPQPPPPPPPPPPAPPPSPESILTIASNARSAFRLGYSTKYQRITQSFISMGHSISGIDFALARSGNPTMPILVGLRESLNGPDLQSLSVAPRSISTSYASPTWVQTTFARSISVTPGRIYFVALHAPQTDGRNYYLFAVDDTNPYPGGTFHLNNLVQHARYDGLFKIRSSSGVTSDILKDLSADKTASALSAIQAGLLQVIEKLRMLMH